MESDCREGPTPQKPHDPHFQDFVFNRQAAEVYLLLDNISGSPLKSLAAPDGVRPGDPRQPFRPGQDPGLEQWIEKICRVQWPPEGSAEQQAEQAAVLILAKDYLNALAKPATGLTIAFTVLVAGEDKADDDDHYGFWAGLWRRLNARRRTPSHPAPLSPPPEPRVGLASERPVVAPPFPPGGPAGGPGGGRAGAGGPPLSRTSLARLAYPGLIKPARRFRTNFNLLVSFLWVFLFVNCLLSWNVAMGNGILSQLQQQVTERTALEGQIDRVDGARADGMRADGKLGDGVGGPKGRFAAPAAPIAAAPGDGADASAPTGFVPYCQRTVMIDGRARYQDATQQRLCNLDLRNRQQYAKDLTNLDAWSAFWNPGPLRSWIGAPTLPAPVAEAPAAGDESRINIQWATVFLTVLGGSVLPICYGFLGAGAAMARQLSSKMRESQLSPRDMTLAKIQLALGAVIGACIGLFAAPPGASGGGGLLAAVPLSASALCFIAGFGVEGVFQALEGLITRVFGTGEAKKAG